LERERSHDNEREMSDSDLSTQS